MSGTLQKVTRKLLRTVANHDPSYYDMYADINEQWYAKLYLTWIARHAEEAGIRPPATLLEAGCQTGRLAIPLAQRGFQVTGIDTSGFALRRAQRYAREVGVQASFIRGDLVRVLERHPQRRYDLVVCAEVVYLSRQYRKMLNVLAGAVRPGGLLCVSHRPLLYYFVEALRVKDAATAEHVLANREGRFRNSEYYNWQTLDELRALYQQLGLQWVDAHPIDRLAWLGGLNLAELSEEQRRRWLELELSLDGATEPCARYVLVVARKS